MPKTEMQVNLSGSLKNASRCISDLVAELKEWMPPDEFEKRMCDLQPDYHAFCLGEIAGHADGVAKGEHSLDDFAAHYCLKRDA